MVEERVQGRLAAILAADVVGYSRMMGEDEEGTLAVLTAHLKELIEPCIAEHRGRVVKTTGDGLLAEFASVVDAVRCAVAFQEGMAERNLDVAGDRCINFRIGVVCHEYRRSTRRCATVREMSEGPSGSVVRD